MLKVLNKVLLLIFFVIIISILFLMTDKKIEVYGIRYGDSLYSSKNIYYEDKINNNIDFSWLFYVIKYKNKIILIDTGFRKDSLINSFNIEYRDPFKLLEEIGINPERVTDIILTHSHFDHIGNIDKFKNARIYIQKEELDYFKKKSEDNNLLYFLENNNNLIVFDNDYNLYNFFEIKKIGGHTVGSSVVSFDYKNNKYIFTGDECYLFYNCKGNYIGTFYDINKNKDFIEWVKNIRNKTILPFHDREIFNIYPTVKEFVVKII